MWLIEVIDFLYFRVSRHQRSQDHAFSLFEEYQHSQFCSASEQKCHQKRPHHSESLPKFEATAIFLAKTLVNDCTKVWIYIQYKLLSVDLKKLTNWGKLCKMQATLHNPLPTKPRFFRRRWKWWRSEERNLILSYKDIYEKYRWRNQIQRRIFLPSTWIPKIEPVKFR